MVQCELGAPSSDGTFLVFTYIWQKDVAEISKVPGAPRNVNAARAITQSVGITIYCTIFKLQSTSTVPVLSRQNTFEKKNQLGKCSLNKLLNLN